MRFNALDLESASEATGGLFEIEGSVKGHWVWKSCMCFCINIHLRHSDSLNTMQLRQVLKTPSRQSQATTHPLSQDPFLTSARISSPLSCFHIWPWVSEFRVRDSSLLE